MNHSKKKTAALCGGVFLAAMIGTAAATSGDTPLASGDDPWGLGITSEAPATEAVAETTEAPQTYDPPETYTPPTPDTSFIDQAYLDTLDSGNVYYSTDQAAIDMGESVCVAFDSGMSWVLVVDTIENSGYAPYDAGYITGAAIGAYCPEYATQVGAA